YNRHRGESIMLTLTQTVIYAADCHTSLFYFQPAMKGPLPLGNSASYNSFYESLAAGVTYQDQSGHAGSILNKFSTFFRKNNYWNRFFASGQIAAYPTQAWEFALPIVCSLKLR